MSVTRPMMVKALLTGLIGAGILAAIISATIGAILLLVILRLVNRRGRW